MTRADRPPGRDTRDGRALTPPGRPPDARSSLKGSDRSVPSGADSGRDLDADLSMIRGSVDDLGVWTGIWEARREPDAFARRCASDAIDAADNRARRRAPHPRPAHRRGPPGRRRHGCPRGRSARPDARRLQAVTWSRPARETLATTAPPKRYDEGSR